jgi:tetratricopeptide (TPR) repeat protein
MSKQLIPPSQETLVQLGILPGQVRLVQPPFRRSQYQAIVNWLTRYNPSTDATNLEQVKGYIEAFYHLCALDEWPLAANLIATQLNTPTQDTLHYQLKLWGYLPEQMGLYEALIDHVEPRWNGRFLQFLGISHQAQGNYPQAKQYLERSLGILQQAGDRIDQGMVLSTLGEVYYALGDYEQAIAHQSAWLAIAREAGLKQGEGIALGSLGNIYESQGHYAAALDYHQQHLAIAREHPDPEMLGAALGNVGSCCHSLGQYEQGKDYHRQHLKLAQTISLPVQLASKLGSRFALMVSSRAAKNQAMAVRDWLVMCIKMLRI